ncbi:uncharacterized protein LOC131943919 isoform X2 [Physella acuta]|nr:uncharacterized protein LOC131943919 isoform X2 [Physella acuta]XP_059160261.1 uncharacterized protein LOC131943919 isoform X2 [Physella acuta]XP_059160262.1 uncharacterized protein LOC131943919 isoform X2 [Physella acuta]
MATLSFNLHNKDGSTQNISHSVAVDQDSFAYHLLFESLQLVQEQCNDILTRLVEAEKVQGISSSTAINVPSISNLEDDEDVGSDNEENLELPPEKRKKL